MPEEITDLARDIADLRRTVRILSDEADRLVISRIIEDAEVRRLLERLAEVHL